MNKNNEWVHEWGKQEKLENVYETHNERRHVVKQLKQNEWYGNVWELLMTKSETQK